MMLICKKWISNIAIALDRLGVEVYKKEMEGGVEEKSDPSDRQGGYASGRNMKVLGIWKC